MQWEVARELRTATRDALERADVPLAGQRDLMATHRAGIGAGAPPTPHGTPTTTPSPTATRDAASSERGTGPAADPVATTGEPLGGQSGRQAQSSRGSPAWTVSPSPTSTVSASGSAWSATTGQTVCSPAAETSTGDHVTRRSPARTV